MNRTEPYDVASLAARTVRLAMAWGVSVGTAIEALALATRLLRDMQSDTATHEQPARYRQLH